MPFNQGFLENVILLALTALVTGFLIPYILKRIDERKLKEQKEVDERKFREQKEFEAELVRQSKVIESQALLLENLAQLMWEYQLLAIEVSFYDPLGQRDLYADAVQKYQKNSGGLFSRIRAEISKALRLTTVETYQELKDLYYEQLLPLDAKLNSLIKKQESGLQQVNKWHEFNGFAVYTLSEMVDNALNNLASEMRLKGRDAKRSSITDDLSHEAKVDRLRRRLHH